MATSSFSSIGFIGLGAMGFPMAQRLLQQLPETTKLHVFDVNAAAVDQLCKESPRVLASSSAKDVTDKSDVILTMVPEGSHVRAVYLDASSGVLQGDVGDKLLIDCSTIDTTTSKEVASQIHSKFPKASFYDAPVSGGVMGAEKGSLTFMLGCADEDPNLPRLKELLGTMGASIFACGGPSLGLTTKLCNNYLSGLIAIATSEAFNIGIRSGLDPRRLSEIFKTSTAQNAIVDKFHPVPGVLPNVPSSRDYEGGFKVQLMRKDFALAVETAETVGAKLVLGDIGLDVYTKASQDERCKDRDSRVVYRYLGGVEDWQKSPGKQ